MSRFIDVDAFKEWLLENSINEREVEESKQIGIWIDAFYSMQNEQSDCEDCIKHGGDWECDRVHCHKGDAISRQATIDEIDEWIKAFRENGHKESAADACLIQDGIIQLPSIQPRKGKWIDSGYGVECSLCGEWYPHASIARNQLNFCPNCGADMRSEQDG